MIKYQQLFPKSDLTSERYAIAEIYYVPREFSPDTNGRCLSIRAFFGNVTEALNVLRITRTKNPNDRFVLLRTANYWKRIDLWND